MTKTLVGWSEAERGIAFGIKAVEFKSKVDRDIHQQQRL